METVFTRLLNGDLPGAILYKDEQVFAFMDAGQVNPGHVLVATTHPYKTLMDADVQTAQALMALAHRVAKAVQEAYQPEGITLLQANGKAGWQTVPHVHMHVVPRYMDDGAELIWPRKDPDLNILEDYAQTLRPLLV